MVSPRLFDPSANRQRVDRYELVGEIASGGMATVYLARLTGVGGFQRFVAIKRLHAHLAGEDEFVEMFLDEARIAARIHHPNVVPILEVGSSSGGYYLAMEYIEGDTLARLIARASSRGMRLPVPIALRITLDMLSGLHAAHELRDDSGQPLELVHRDVSPQNVLVGADGIVRITDFGVARAASRLSATRVGQLKGKIAYMSPEQVAGEEELDRRADVFSSGIVVWEALTGRRLFKSDHDASTLTRVMSEPIVPPARVMGGIGQELNDVVMRALDRDKTQRYASAAQFASALEKAASRERVASARELAAYVNDVMGVEITRHRDAVRAWVSSSEPSQATSSPFVGAVSIPGLEHSHTTSPTAMSIVERRSPAQLALGVLLLIGLAFGGAFYVARAASHNSVASREPIVATSLGALGAPSPSGPKLTATELHSLIASPSPALPAAPSALRVVSPESLPAEAPLAVPHWPAPRRASPKPTASAAAARSDPPPPSTNPKSDDDVDLRNPYR